jgi:hypothetical protein
MSSIINAIPPVVYNPNIPVIYDNGTYPSYPSYPVTRDTIIDISTPTYSPYNIPTYATYSPSYATYSPSYATYSPTYTPVYTLDTSYVYNLPTLVSSTYEYQDVNADPELHQKVMKNIYTTFYNTIIPNQFPHLLNYVTSKRGYSMVKSYSQYKSNKTKEGEYEPKLKYLSNNVYSKTEMYKDVKSYLKTYDIKWYDIDNNKKDIYELLINKLKTKLENLTKK